MSDAVTIKNVTKMFGKTLAVNNVSFSIEEGSTVAILGPNGAGKTTAISMMLGLIDPTEGHVQLFDKDPKEIEVRKRIGAMLQEVSVVDKLKVREIIALFRSYYPNPLSMKELIDLTGLSNDDLNKWADKLSGGQSRRVGFALALAGNPDLIFFDEPTVGLDISARRLFWEKVDLLKANGKTVIFTTHYLQEADDVAERIILFHHGDIIADGKPDDIKRKLTGRNVSFRTNDEDAISKLQELPMVTGHYEKSNRHYLISEDTDAVLAAIFQQRMDVKDIWLEQGRLEEAFEQLTAEPREVGQRERNNDAV
ncbi:ABC transporter ATP-binding protein [Virgibacillus phasianinus]|uniref:ABC transporter ATP-binding protein n=1 Tax=Virgibacillus phasianinus TaxID=2017483 RepID=A0A220U7F3_9BACI|nr:ABC transporter ATP-binding protein [Virgibacillus phasianinus]ASK64069.1 ABC transporter ATP-binding protein [Virgibacillus phasianinus]